MTNSKKQHCDASECPLAHSLDIIGDKWTLLIIRDMLVCNKHEYKEFMESPEGISTNILADRLKKLEGANVIKSIPHPDYKTRKLYYLTPAGKAFMSVLGALVDWAHGHLEGVEPPEDGECDNIVAEMMQAISDWEIKYLGKEIV